MRSVEIRATGPSGRSRTMASTTSFSSSGTPPPTPSSSGSPNLGAGVRACRQLEVPAGVGPAGTPAQRHAVGRQVVGRGVEVDGLELLRRRPLHPRDRRKPLERRRNRGFEHVELPLDLGVPGRLRRAGSHLHLRRVCLGQPSVPYPGEQPIRARRYSPGVTEYQTITLEQSGPIARITLNRPDAANGMNDTMTRELADAARRSATPTRRRSWY